MRLRIGVVCVVAAALGCRLISSAQADETAAAGRQIAAKWKDSILTVQMLVKITDKWEDQTSEEEVKFESTGTVIDPSGMVVAGLSATIPTEAGSKASGDETESRSSEVKETKLIMPDGREVPAAVVARDRELDLVFIKPTTKPEKPLAAVDLSKSAKLELMDEMVCLFRLGPVASRALAACSDRVLAVVEKPRTFYAPGLPMMSASLGAPVFAPNGSPVGLLLLRILPGGSESQQISGIGGNGTMYFILPAADVLEAARQAGEAK